MRRTCGVHRRQGFAIPRLIRRGLRSGLVGRGNLILTVGDDGWNFDGRPTNVQTGDFRGYPVMDWKSIARPFDDPYSEWARTFGSNLDRIVAKHCMVRYRF